MEASHASDAVVAVVRMYTGLLGEKAAEIAGLKGDVGNLTSLFTTISHRLEAQEEGLSIRTPGHAAQVVMDLLEQASQNGQILFEQAAQTGKIAAALREALIFAGANAADDGQVSVLTLVGRVSKAIVDLKAIGTADRGRRGMAYTLVVQWARAWAEAPRAKGNVEGLIKAVQKLDLLDQDSEAARERGRREDEVLAAARAYGAIGGSDNGPGSFARNVLRDAAINLAALDLKPA